MSITSCLNAIQWKEHTQIWVIHNEWGKWISSPPRILIPASYMADLHMKNTRTVHSDLDLTKPGLYDLTEKTITFVHNARPDISSLVNPAGYPDWEIQKKVLARDGIIYIEPTEVYSYLAPFKFILDNAIGKTEVYTYLYRHKLMVRVGNDICGILETFRPELPYGRCDICRLPANYQTTMAGITVSACPAHRSRVEQILETKIFLEKLSPNS